MTPLVSVLIAAYNQARFIEATVASVLRQTYTNFEVIVVDDGSTDDTARRLERFSDRIVYVRQSNQGIRGGQVLGGWAARNTGIQRARGELLAFLDGDDLWEPDKLTVQVAAARDNPGSGLIAVDGVQFDDRDGTALSSSLLGSPVRNLRDGDVVTASFYHELLSCNFISTTSLIMVPSRVFERVGLLDSVCGSDYGIYLKIAARYDLTLVKRRLARWRYHPTSVSGPMQRRRVHFGLILLAVLKRHLEEADPEARRFIQEQIAKRLSAAARTTYYHGRSGDRLWAARQLWRLCLENRSSFEPILCLAALCCPQLLVSLTRRTCTALSGTSSASPAA
jgi:glycosyltransferase involved in cell wall biosynthesis